ncbi:hypothetical protein BX666DRAFT_1989674 [Dichotomocladium elegans]|nr:hypothetical protein BX666DRAFT_1989674 [Dichotomocladium elegans]
MAHLLELPTEVVLRILSHVEPSQILIFLSISTVFSHLADNEGFWKALAKPLGITAGCQPYTSWKQLYLSGDLLEMCPHLVECMQSITADILQSVCISTASERLYCVCRRTHIPLCPDFGICLGCDDKIPHCLRFKPCSHPVTLKLAMINFAALNCSICQKEIGKPCSPLTERHWARNVIQLLMASSGPDRLEQRRVVEQTQFKLWFHTWDVDVGQKFVAPHGKYLVDTAWFNAWTDFLKGASDEVPGPLSSKGLLRVDGSIDPTMTVGKDFVVLSEIARFYITRVYGLEDRLLSMENIMANPEYARLVHSVRVQDYLRYHRSAAASVVQ